MAAISPHLITQGVTVNSLLTLTLAAEKKERDEKVEGWMEYGGQRHDWLEA